MSFWGILSDRPTQGRAELQHLCTAPFTLLPLNYVQKMIRSEETKLPTFRPARKTEIPPQHTGPPMVKHGGVSIMLREFYTYWENTGL